MVNISKIGDSAIKFTFTNNDRYLYNGEITVPLNSLILEFDSSDLVIFKKIDGDVFVTFLLGNSNFNSKAQLESWFKDNAVGGGDGITSGEVQTMIDESISGKQDNSIALTQAEYDALVASGTVDPDIFYIITDAPVIDISNYYTSAETDSAIAAAVSGKQDTLSAGTGIDITDNVISATGGGGTTYSAGTNISIANDTISCTIPAYRSGSSNGISLNYNSNTASGTRSIAGGSNCKATSENAVALGYSCEAKNSNTFAMGQYAIASGFCSAAICREAQAKNMAEFACGEFNISHKASDTYGDSGNTLFSVGNGTADNARHNAFEIRQNGDIYLSLNGQDVKLQDQLGGGSITIDPSLDSGSTNAVANSAVSAALNYNDKFLYRVDPVYNLDNHPTGALRLRWRNPYNGSSATTQDNINLVKINNIPLIEDYVSGISNLSLVETSAITSSVTSASTDSEIPTAKAVYDAIPQGGGGSSYSAGTNIDITNDTINCTLPISSTTQNNDSHTIIFLLDDDTSNPNTIKNNKSKGNFIVGYGNHLGNDFEQAEYNIIFGHGNRLEGFYSNVRNKKNFVVGDYNFFGSFSSGYAVSNSAVFGEYNNPKNDYEYVFGKYNNSVSASTTFGDSGNTLFSVGNGTADNARHNAFEIRQNGDIYLNNGTSDVKLQDYIQIKSVKLTQAQYDALSPNYDANTLYIITNVVS